VKRFPRNRKLYALGHTLLKAKQTPMSGALVPIGAEALHILGEKLIRVAKGEEDARFVFEQKKIGRPSQSERDWRIASIYWMARANGANHRSAIKAVREALPALKLADSGIQKVAQKMMVHMIGTESTAPLGDLPNGVAGALDFAEPELNLHALRAQVAKKAHRGR
jgi:hypothetical protein